MFVANRDVEKARDLASQFGGFALPLSELDGTLPEADILITSTSAPEPIITLEQVKRAVSPSVSENQSFAVDIAVPRDIEPEVARTERRLPVYDR